MIEIIKTLIPGVLVVRPRVFGDARGYFCETYSSRDFAQAIAEHCPEIGAVEFVQDNESMSSRGVVRGLHYQKPPYTQSKLVRCTSGTVLDIAVDLRVGSPTFRRHVAVELSSENRLQLFIPKGFAHGFAVLSDTAVFQYKCDEFYHPEADAGISLLDPSLGISWPFSPQEMLLSEKDRCREALSEDFSDFNYGVNLYK